MDPFSRLLKKPCEAEAHRKTDEFLWETHVLQSMNDSWVWGFARHDSTLLMSKRLYILGMGHDFRIFEYSI